MTDPSIDILHAHGSVTPSFGMTGTGNANDTPCCVLNFEPEGIDIMLVRLAGEWRPVRARQGTEDLQEVPLSLIPDNFTPSRIEEMWQDHLSRPVS